MSPTRFMTIASLAAAIAGVLAFGPMAGVRSIEGSSGATTGLGTIRWSGADTSQAMVLAGFALLVCSSHSDCTR
ncbi:MAG TPA: hypothetical protein VMT83_01480 [Burkholderiaceae bacterium]|nr:hypothetical protein [Burkholderiaceae bacterium]